MDKADYFEKDQRRVLRVVILIAYLTMMGLLAHITGIIFLIMHFNY